MNSAKAFGVIGLVAASLARPAQAASPAAEASARLLQQIEPRIKAIYETNEFAMRSFGATWLPDGSGYLRLETPAGASGAEIMFRTNTCAATVRSLTCGWASNLSIAPTFTFRCQNAPRQVGKQRHSGSDIPANRRGRRP